MKHQLQQQLNGYEVLSQSTGCQDVFPYNPYFKSTSDILIYKPESSDSIIVHMIPPPRPEETEEMDEVEQEQEPELSMEMIVTEFKKSKTKGDRNQLYAEAGVSRLVERVQLGNATMETEVKVYCILTDKDCQQGSISELVINLKNYQCKIIEQAWDSSLAECFNILLPKLK